MTNTTTQRTTTIVRHSDCTVDILEGEIILAICRASTFRRKSKVRFDFDDEGVMELGRNNNRYEAAIRDMATALFFRNCKSVNVFPNMLKSVSVECR